VFRCSISLRRKNERGEKMTDTKTKTKAKKIQGRSWQLIIPSEWQNISAIKEVCKSISRNYYYMLHDNDKNELNEPVKPHWHLLMTMGSSRDLSTMQNYFKDFPELLENSFEKIGSIHWAKRYLVHADDPNKHQYNPANVETNDKAYKDLFIEFASKIEETKYIQEVFDQAGLVQTFAQFRAYFTNQLASMSIYSRMSMLMQLERYWKEKQEGDTFAKQYDKSFTEVNPNLAEEKYKINLSNGSTDDLPF